MLAQDKLAKHSKPIDGMSDNRAREATKDMFECAHSAATTLNPNYPNIALLALADKIRKDCSEPEIPEPYPPSWAQLKVKYERLSTKKLGVTELRDHRRQVLSEAIGEGRDIQYGMLKKVSDYFGVTTYEANCARLHSLEHGAGMPTPAFSYSRQGLSKNATELLMRFSVNDRVVLRMPGRASGETQERFKRCQSLTSGYKLLEQMRIEHNDAYPNDMITNPISYGKYVQAMSANGYSRMRCYTGVCECCHSNGHVNWESLLRLFSDVRSAFLQLRVPNEVWPEHLEPTLEGFTSRVRTLRNYYNSTFKTHVSHDTNEASHNIKLALSHPDESSPFHVNLDHMDWVQECKECNDRIFVIADLKAAIEGLLACVQMAESAPTAASAPTATSAPTSAPTATSAPTSAASPAAASAPPLQPQPAQAPAPAVPCEQHQQLSSLLARLEVIDKRISKLIGHHIRDVNAELYQELIKAGLALDETSADFGEFAWRLYNAPTNGMADVRMQIT